MEEKKSSRDKIGGFKKAESKSLKLGTRLNHWKMKADEFYRASEYLWLEISKDFKELINKRKKELAGAKFKPRPYRPFIDQPYFLLISLSVENLLKGLLIFNKPELLGEKLDKAIKTHNLQKVAEKLDLTFSEDENNFLEMATTLINWYSRYPIPAKVDDGIQGAHFSYDKIRDTYLNLFSRLSEEIKKTGGLTVDYNYKFSSDPTRHL